MKNVNELKTIDLVKEITKLYMKDFFQKKIILINSQKKLC